MRYQTKQYTGRFAPSPTGALHLGSIVTAVASYIRAKQKNGNWLLRIDDLDKRREKIGARDLIFKGLESLSLNWDGLSTQSDNHHEYENAILLLENKNLTYRCTCSRKSLPRGPYPGTCRRLSITSSVVHSIRVKATDSVRIKDELFGEIEENINRSSGDFLIKPRDRVATYHLAVVVDDLNTRVTEIVRGADLLSSTPLQVYLYTVLGYSPPNYFHIPVVADARGVKLSKQTGASPVDINNSQPSLIFALDILGFGVPDGLRSAKCSRLLEWAIYESQINIKKAIQSRFNEEIKNAFNSS